MLRCTRAPFGTFLKVFFRILSGVVHYQWDARRLWNIRAMILFRGSDSETVALNLFRSNMASKGAKLSAVIVVFSGCVGWLALVSLETWREDSLFCFLSISANMTSGIFLADWTCPVWNTGHLKRIPAALQDAPIWIILFLTSRKITISEWIWFQVFEVWEMQSARKNHLWLTHILI